jgi:hypothetical protein
MTLAREGAPTNKISRFVSSNRLLDGTATLTASRYLLLAVHL